MNVYDILKGNSQSTASTPEQVYSIYDEQTTPSSTEAVPVNYGTIYGGLRTNPPPYSVSFGPFYVATNEIQAFANQISALTTAANSLVSTVSEINTFIQTELSDLNIPPISFDISVIIDSIDFSFSLVDAASGRCGLSEDLPTTVLGAVMGVVHTLQKNILGQVINFLHKVEYMFSVPTRMIGNLETWVTGTKSTIKTPLAEKRADLMNTLKGLREECKQKNDPVVKVQMLTQMNLLGDLDRKIRKLVVLLTRLEDDISRLYIALDNCYRMGKALAMTLNAIMAAWQKDAVCIQTKFKSLITLVG